MAVNKEDLPYRPCVGLMIINQDYQVFVGQRLDQQVEAWQMPQGGIDPGEDAETAALREMAEEIGTDKAEIIAMAGGDFLYDLPDHLVGKVWKGKYRGQSQKWFLLRFTGNDSDINIETEHPEFGEWRWSPLNELIDMAVPFKRDVYTEVVTALAPHFPADKR